jgi:ABC-type polysaccharide/polyol phosphate export permease
MSQTPTRVTSPPAAGRRGPGTPPPNYIDPKLHVMAPTRRRVQLHEVWTSFPVARMLGLRDIKVKYKQSALGPLWLMLQPLGMLAAIVVAFSAVAGIGTGDIPYTVFALVGLAIWTYFQMTLTAATMTLPGNSSVVRRSPCPRLALVTATLIGTLPPFLVLMPASIVAAAVTIGLPLQAVLLPLVLLWVLAFTWGVILLVSALAGRFRDMTAFAPLIVQAGIFLTPVGYPLDAAGGAVTIIALNPVSGLIEAARWSVLGLAPDMFAIGAAAGWTAGVLLVGWYIFGRMETRFADYV